MNTVLSVLFAEGFWVRDFKAKRIAQWLLAFLGRHQKVAKLSFLGGRNRFAMVPKVHYIHHFPFELLDQSGKSKWSINPLATSCQMQESFIGAPSRVSRRVSIRCVHLRSFHRSLLLSHESLSKALCDERGLDAYSYIDRNQCQRQNAGR